MEEQNGIYMIPCKVNGIPMKFVFDTGASSVSISKTEVLFLVKQGLISDKDIIGETSYRIANGDVESGIRINLKTIQIDDLLIENIEATVVDQENAPLLLGQSAISQLGPYMIDGNKLILQQFKNKNPSGDIKKLDEKYGFKTIKFDSKPYNFIQLKQLAKQDDLVVYQNVSYDVEDITILNHEFDVMYLAFSKPEDLLSSIVLFKYYDGLLDLGLMKKASQDWKQLIEFFTSELGQPYHDAERDVIFWKGSKVHLLVKYQINEPTWTENMDTVVHVVIRISFIKQNENTYQDKW